MICLSAVLLLGACTKEGAGLRLVAEGMDGAKVAVDGGNSYWATGDKVLINGVEATVTVDGTTGEGSVSNDDVFEAPFYGVYPSDIYEGNSGNAYLLDLPSEYTYATADGRQNVQSPMVAFANGGQTLVFRHVTAAVNVQVVNYYGFTVAVDSIVVVSDRYQLCGRREVTLDGDLTVAEVDTGLASVRRVKMNFSPEAPLEVLAGDSAVVQVPVLPVGGDNHFTVKVSVHKVDQPDDVKADFSRTQLTGGALGRAHMGYARFVTGGLFSVSATKRVIISQGNLQYQASSGTWRFATAQYGSIGNATGNNNFSSDRSSQEAWIDLFGWGTSGWKSSDYPFSYHQPYDYIGTGNLSYGYYYGPNSYSDNIYINSYSLTGAYANSDWGVYNAIDNGGNAAGRWRTMTGGSSGEMNYLFTVRSASTLGGTSDARFTRVNLNGVYGAILFPDEYTQPDGVPVPSRTIINSTAEKQWTSVGSVSLDNWYKMEAAGAVFLPCQGYRNYPSGSPSYTSSCGEYWTSTYRSTPKAYSVEITNTITTCKELERRCGCFVRLVREVQ